MDWAEHQKVIEAARALSHEYPDTYEGLEFEPYRVVWDGHATRVTFRGGGVTFIRDKATGQYKKWTY